MKVVYVAGPYRGRSAWEIEQNIRKAEELALEVWRSGAAAICPHANTRYFQGAAPDAVWLDGDLEILARCDAVILVDGWGMSEGTTAEIRFAKETGIPVFKTLGGMREWFATERANV
jgi:nucleoside 2-deoxyribosyltransferase